MLKHVIIMHFCKMCDIAKQGQFKQNEDGLFQNENEAYKTSLWLVGRSKNLGGFGG